MPTSAQYKNDIDTVTVSRHISGAGCWVCGQEIAAGAAVGRDHRALCHPNRQTGAGDFGHAGCIDDAITSGKGSDYTPEPSPGEGAEGRMSKEEIDALAKDIAKRAPDRVGKAIHEALENADIAVQENSTPHERSTARRWVNFAKGVTGLLVTDQGITDGVDQLHGEWSQQLDDRLAGKSPAEGQAAGGEGNNEKGGVEGAWDAAQECKKKKGQEAEGQEGDGQDDQNGQEANDGQDGGTEGGNATEGDEGSEGGDGKGETPQGAGGDDNATPPEATDTDYVTHPEMDDAIAEAKQDMDTRLMGVGVRLAEQFAEVRDDVTKVNKAIEDFGKVDASTHEIEVKIRALLAGLASAEKAAAQQVRVIEIKRADKVTRLADEFYHDQFDAAIKMIGRGRDVFLTGPTGCGKTHMGAQIARALGLDFSSCSLTEGIDESHFWGRAELNKHGGMEFYDGQFVQRVEKGGLYLMDEVDAGDPNVLLTINSITSNGFCNVPNRHQNPEARRHEDFVLVCGANTIGKGADRRYVGRNQIDLATLNRFELIEMDYDRNLEGNLVAGILEGSEAAEFCGWANNIRDKIESNRLEQVFGTRELLWRAEDRQLGDSYEEIESRVFAGWRTDEVAKVKIAVAGARKLSAVPLPFVGRQPSPPTAVMFSAGYNNL